MMFYAYFFRFIIYIVWYNDTPHCPLLEVLA